ncbi:MAG TPA: alkaline phosphatase family protein [Candidatus Sulfotelmatobacter sp.]
MKSVKLLGLLFVFAVSHLIASAQTGPVPHSSHIWIVAEENHSYEDVINNSGMPYFNSLANTYGLATQYYSTQHNSLSALMWLVAGEQVTSDDDAAGCFNVDNVVRHLLAQKSTWKAYEEDLPYSGFQGLSWADYVRRHNPLIDFTDSCASSQINNSVPFTQLAIDMENNATPTYAYITPNLNDDAHDGTLQQADLWLSEQIPAILARPEFQPGGDGLMFIQWDEGDESGSNPDDRCASNIQTGCGGRVATLVIGPQVKPAYQSNVLYSHVNLLATVCAAAGFTSCPGAGALADPMSDFFNTVSIGTPFNNAVVASPVQISATTSNSSAVTAMQIYVDNALQYQVSGSQVNAAIPMSSGAHNVVVQSWDAKGGVHKSGINVTVQSESVVITTPAPNAVVSSPVKIAATGGGTSAVYAMQIYVDNTLQYQANGASVNTSLSMSAGQHYIVVQAWDDWGGIRKNGFYVTVAAPSITISSPSANYSGYSPVEMIATSVDANPVYAMQIYVDNILSYQYTGPGVQAAMNMTAGTHNVVFQAWDTAGGIYKKSATVNVTPIVPVFSAPTANSNVASPMTVNASVQSDAPVATMQLYVDNNLQYTVSGLSLNTQVTLSPGTHYLVAQAWDTGGGTWKTGEYVTVP